METEARAYKCWELARRKRYHNVNFYGRNDLRVLDIGSGSGIYANNFAEYKTLNPLLVAPSY